MRASKFMPKSCLAFFLCSAAPFCGCGRRESPPLSEGAENLPAGATITPRDVPLDQQIEQKLDPLTKEDVELYLSVMRAAAERVKNPAPADIATLEAAKKILAGSAAGRIPTPEDVRTLERANLVAISMDQIVAGERKLDGRAYRGIVEAVEAVVPEPALGAPARGEAPAAKQSLSSLEQRLNQVNGANEKFLAPYRQAIQSLMAIVRDPARLPK